MLDKVINKLENTKGRKLAAQDVKVIHTTALLRKWVNAQRRASVAAKRANAQQIKRKALGGIKPEKARLQGDLPLALPKTPQNAGARGGKANISSTGRSSQGLGQSSLGLQVSP